MTQPGASPAPKPRNPKTQPGTPPPQHAQTRCAPEAPAGAATDGFPEIGFPRSAQDQLLHRAAPALPF